MVIYLMFALLRNTNEMQTSIKQQRLGSPAGQTLYGKTVLVIGFGNIAKELIPRQGCGEVLGHMFDTTCILKPDASHAQHASMAMALAEPHIAGTAIQSQRHVEVTSSMRIAASADPDLSHR